MSEFMKVYNMVFLVIAVWGVLSFIKTRQEIKETTESIERTIEDTKRINAMIERHLRP